MVVHGWMDGWNSCMGVRFDCLSVCVMIECNALMCMLPVCRSVVPSSLGAQPNHCVRPSVRPSTCLSVCLSVASKEQHINGLCMHPPHTHLAKRIVVSGRQTRQHARHPPCQIVLMRPPLAVCRSCYSLRPPQCGACHRQMSSGRTRAGGLPCVGMRVRWTAGRRRARRPPPHPSCRHAEGGSPHWPCRASVTGPRCICRSLRCREIAPCPGPPMGPRPHQQDRHGPPHPHSNPPVARAPAGH
mmetsp:Transcript_46915/g.116940  ORF Transcript_46915/g.116940 Transcript_46915/m.116940 type:complete len:243 (+) Transcript_46915:1111-1839(+)